MPKVQVTTKEMEDGKVHAVVAHDCGEDTILATATLVRGLETMVLQLDAALKRLKEGLPVEAPPAPGPAGSIVRPNGEQVRVLGRSR